jgi:hypothetical protein
MYKYVHCRKIYNLSVLALEQVDTRVFGEFYLQAMYVVFILQCQKVTNNCQITLEGVEEFEDTKGIIRIRKSKVRQHNG